MVSIIIILILIVSMSHVGESKRIVQQNEDRLFHVVTPGGNAVEGALFVKMREVAIPVTKFDYKTNENVTKWVLAKPFDLSRWKETRECFGNEFTKGKCMWCSSSREERQCIKGGTLTVTGFRDDQRKYSLHSRNRPDLVALRPDLCNRKGHAEFDQIFITCNELESEIPFGVSGILMVDPLAGLPPQHVSARIDLPKERKSTSVVCTKSFYGRVPVRVVRMFLQHYLTNWDFDRIVTYELGTTIGPSLLEVIQDIPGMKMMLVNNRIVHVDLRNELQRIYGPNAGEAVLYSSKNGQMVIMSDCITRAKAMGAEWILPIDWDEFLTVGPELSSLLLGRQVKSLSRILSQLDIKATVYRDRPDAKRITLVDIRRRQVKQDPLMCEHGVWNETYVFKEHQRLAEQGQVDHIEPLEDFGKYAVRVEHGDFPIPVHCGLHQVSTRCAFPTYVRDRLSRVLLWERYLYLRHIRCLTKLK